MTALAAAVHVVSFQSPHQFERSMQVAAIFKEPPASSLTTASKTPVGDFSRISPAEAGEARLEASTPTTIACAEPLNFMICNETSRG